MGERKLMVIDNHEYYVAEDEVVRCIYCDKPIASGMTDGYGNNVHDECFPHYMNTCYGRKNWKQTDDDGCGGYYLAKDKDGEWKGTGFYYTDWSEDYDVKWVQDQYGNWYKGFEVKRDNNGNLISAVIEDRDKMFRRIISL